MKNALIFSPYAAIWDHSFIEATVGSAFKDMGYKVRLMGCGSLLENHCIASSCFNATPGDVKKRLEICRKCEGINRAVELTEQIEGTRLSAFYDERHEAEIEHLVASLTPENVSSFSFDGIDIGKLTLYDYALRFKLKKLKFIEEQWQLVLTGMKNSLRAYFSLSTYFTKHPTDIIICYNYLYSINAIATHVAKKIGVKFLTIHSTVNINQLYKIISIASSNVFDDLRQDIAAWEKNFKDPVAEIYLKDIEKHFFRMISSSSYLVYSSGMKGDFSLREYFKIPEGKKIILAGMSSYDERFGAEIAGLIDVPKEMPFKDQEEWIKALIEFIQEKEDYFLIIRVHPRDFPNRRDETISEQAKVLAHAFKNLPSNVVVNWPDDKLSLYDVLPQIDLCLTSWSGIAREAGFYGVPSVVYSDELIYYSTKLSKVGKTRESYFRTIDEAIRDGHSIDNVVSTFRWFAFEYFYRNFDINYAHDTLSRGNKYLVKGTNVINRIIPFSKNYLDLKFKAKSTEKMRSLLKNLVDEKNDFNSSYHLNYLQGDLTKEREYIIQFLLRVKGFYKNFDIANTPFGRMVSKVENEIE